MLASTNSYFTISLHLSVTFATCFCDRFYICHFSFWYHYYSPHKYMLQFTHVYIGVYTFVYILVSPHCSATIFPRLLYFLDISLLIPTYLSIKASRHLSVFQAWRCYSFSNISLVLQFLLWYTYYVLISTRGSVAILTPVSAYMSISLFRHTAMLVSLQISITISKHISVTVCKRFSVKMSALVCGSVYRNVCHKTNIFLHSRFDTYQLVCCSFYKFYITVPTHISGTFSTSFSASFQTYV